MELVKSITICDVGPRDGLQNEKKLLSVQEKQSMIEGLADAGVPVIEVGSFVHPKAVPQMATIDEIFQNLRRKEGTEYRALIANLKGVERAVKCGCPKVKMNVSARKAHNLANLNCTPAETVSSFRPCADMARTENLELSGSIAMAFGSPWEGEIPLSDVKEIVDGQLPVSQRGLPCVEPVLWLRLCTSTLLAAEWISCLIRCRKCVIRPTEKSMCPWCFVRREGVDIPMDVPSPKAWRLSLPIFQG